MHDKEIIVAEILHGYRLEYMELGFEYNIAVMLAWKRYVRRQKAGLNQF